MSRITISQSDLPIVTRLLGVFDTVSKDDGLSNCFVAKYEYDSPVVGRVEVSYIQGEDSLRISAVSNGHVFYSGLPTLELPDDRAAMNWIVDQILPEARK